MNDLSTATKFVCVWDVPTQGKNTRDAVAQNVSREVEGGFLCVAHAVAEADGGGEPGQK